MRKFLSCFFVIVLCLALLASCGKKTDTTAQTDTAADGTDTAAAAAAALPQLSGPKDGDTVVVFETSKGTFKAVLYADAAPKTVENFLALVNKGYYSNILFHRVVANFVIQSGDPTGTGTGGKSASGAAIPNEVSETLHNFTGALGMANNKADNNQSQFYVVCANTVPQETLDAMAALPDDGYPAQVVDAYKQLGGQPTLDYRYTVFGQVYEGLDVVAKIAAVKVDDNSKPVKDVKLLSVTVETYAAQK